MIYLKTHKRKSRTTVKKIIKAVEYGLHDPVHIHPKIDPARCIGSGACIKACPEHDIIGCADGKGKLVNASRCIGHGACAAACPVGAITLVFGTETRGVEIPYITPHFETNVEGVFIVGELGGMGLIRNAITQGREAVEYIASMKKRWRAAQGVRDLLIVGSGPAGIGASLAAIKAGLDFIIIDQDDIGGTVLHYPRHKIVMTSPVELPTYGKIHLKQTTKEALLELWQDVIMKSGLKVRTFEKMTGLARTGDHFTVTTTKGEHRAMKIVLAIGRRGTPRKLGIPGEKLSKVTYRLIEPEQHRDRDIIVVGGGDSAVEAALALADQQPPNRVIISYRGDSFARIKPQNHERLKTAAKNKTLQIMLGSNLKEIAEKDVIMETAGSVKTIKNDFVYIFAGGELPNEFLKSIGIRIEKKFGEA